MQNPPLLQDLEAHAPMYKIGRRTGFTCGRYDGLRSVHLETFHDSSGKQVTVVTEESVVIGIGNAKNCFSETGDSGSFIFDYGGRFVGLLFAGNMDTGACYFTPAEVLFQDIKNTTGAKDVRLVPQE